MESTKFTALVPKSENGKAITHREHYKFLVTEVAKIIANGEVDFYRVAWALKTIRDHKLYEVEGLKTLTECGAKRFGYSKGYVSDSVLMADVGMNVNEDGSLDVIRDVEGKVFKSTALLTIIRFFNAKKNEDGTKRTAQEVRDDVLKFIEESNIQTSFTITVIKDRLKATEAIEVSEESDKENDEESTEESAEVVEAKDKAEEIKVEEIEGDATALVKWFRNYLKDHPEVTIDRVYKLICKN